VAGEEHGVRELGGQADLAQARDDFLQALVARQAWREVFWGGAGCGVGLVLEPGRPEAEPVVGAGQELEFERGQAPAKKGKDMLSWLLDIPAFPCFVVAYMTGILLLAQPNKPPACPEADHLAELEARLTRLEARLKEMDAHMLRVDTLVVEILCKHLGIIAGDEAGESDSDNHGSGDDCDRADVHGGELRGVAGPVPVADHGEPVGRRVCRRHRAGDDAGGVLEPAGVQD
jgi:hypothetical protein